MPLIGAGQVSEGGVAETERDGANEMPELEGAERDQAEVITLLMDPATHGGASVQRVDTHISRLFLTGERVYKLKRSIKTNYLDFSTPERRKASCEREMEVNSEAGELYRGVVPVVREGDHLALGGSGEPVDWLVEMQRFDRSQELDRLLQAGTLGRTDVERLADVIADLHSKAPIVRNYGDSADLLARIAQISEALGDASGARETDAVKAWHEAAVRAVQENEALVDQRFSMGRVRRCHGDLHLGNIVMIEERPTPFDAIEFNEEIASIDVLYDLALAASDLLMRARRDLAGALLDRYLSATRDYRGLALWPLLLSMRAAVRAMTAASRGETEDAATALGFARHALDPAPLPVLVAVGGISGSGKSSVARELAPGIAPLTGAVILRSDVIRKRLWDVEPEAPLPADAYSSRMNDRVLVRMVCDARRALRAGRSVILDATFLDPTWSNCAGELAERESVGFTGVWLALDEDEAARRISGRGSDASDATQEVVQRQASKAHVPEGWSEVDANGQIEAVAAAAADCIFAGDRG